LKIGIIVIREWRVFWGHSVATIIVSNNKFVDFVVFFSAVGVFTKKHDCLSRSTTLWNRT